MTQGNRPFDARRKCFTLCRARRAWQTRWDKIAVARFLTLLPSFNDYSIGPDLHTGPHALAAPSAIPRDPSCRAVLGVLLVLYALLWPLVALLSHHSPPLDMIEGFVWSLHPQAGYYKHPPLTAWIISTSVALLGKQPLALLVLGPLSIVVALVALWWLARQFLDERLALVAVLLTTTQLYFNVLIPEFNHNVIQIPLWACSITLFWMATQRGQLIWFIALGVSLGLCALAKYSAALLYLFMVIWMLIDAGSRRHLSLGKVFSCVVVAAVVMAPNLFWLVGHDFQPLHYAQERMSEHLSAAGRVGEVGSFLAAQLGSVIVMLMLTVWLARTYRATSGVTPLASDEARHRATSPALFLFAASTLPFLFSLAVPLIAGRPLRDMWAMMMFTPLGLALVCWRPGMFASLYQRRWLFAWLILHGLLLGVYAGSVYYKTQLRPSLSRANFPGPELARLIEADWQKKTGVPLAYLVGSTWAAGNVSFYATATPAVLINGDFSISPWVSPTRIKACGYVALWASEKSTREPGAWMSEMNPGLPEETAELSHPTQPAIRVAVRWVIIPPAGRCGA